MSKSLTGVLLFFVLAVSSLAQANGESYRNAILNSQTRGPYEVALGQKCVQALIKHYESGQDLSSQYVQSVAHSISQHTKAYVKGYPLYHYQNSESISADLTSYRDVALRGYGLDMNGWTNQESTVIYISLNPYTSANYGKNLITYWMNEKTMIIRNEYTKNYAGLVANIIKADKKFKNLLPLCKQGVSLVVFEDSGIDLVDYMSGLAPDAQWYYMVSSKNILSADILKMNEAGSTLRSDEEKERVRINSYLKQHSRTEEISQ